MDSDKVIAILAVYHSILEFKLNNEYELKVQTFSLNADLKANTPRTKN